MKYSSSIMKCAEILVLWFLSSKVHAETFSKHAVKDIIKNVLTVAKLHDVTLVADKTEIDGTSDLFIREMSKSIGEIFPLRILDFDFNRMRLSTSYMSTSRTLFVCVFSTNLPPDRSKIDELGKNIRELIVRSHDPKILLITIANQWRESYENIFRDFWSNRFLHVTILEMMRSDDVNEIPIKVHEFNPFFNNYTKSPYIQGLNLFPDKLKNINGHPIIYNAVHRPPNSVVKRNAAKEIIYFGSVDGLMINTSIRAMGATLKFDSFATKIVNGTIMEKSTLEVIQNVVDGIAEFHGNVIPISGKLINIRYTNAIGWEPFCAVVPRIPGKKQGNFTSRVFITFFIVLLIVYIFRGSAVLFKLDLDIWKLLNIVALFLNVSVSKQPNTLIQRVFFLCFVLVASLFSSILYTEIVAIGVEVQPEVEFHTIKDLRTAGLQPFYVAGLRNSLLNQSVEEDFLWLVDKAKPIEWMSDCSDYMVRFKNSTCIMFRLSWEFEIGSRIFNGEPNLKSTDICFGNYPIVYIFFQYSPYVERINEIILNILTAGLSIKWKRDYLRENTRIVNDNQKDGNTIFSPLRLFLIIGIVGYGIAIVVFFGEMLVTPARKRKYCPSFNRSNRSRWRSKWNNWLEANQ